MVVNMVVFVLVMVVVVTVLVGLAVVIGEKCCTSVLARNESI